MTNDKDDNNYKEDNDDKGISALRLDRDLGFSQGHQGYQGHRSHDDDERRMTMRWRTTITTMMTRVSKLWD